MLCQHATNAITGQAYALQAKKDDWASLNCFCTGVNPVNNSISYGVWATHKGGWQDIPRIFHARTEFNLFMKQYLANRNIKYVFSAHILFSIRIERIADISFLFSLSRLMVLKRTKLSWNRILQLFVEHRYLVRFQKVHVLKNILMRKNTDDNVSQLLGPPQR